MQSQIRFLLKQLDYSLSISMKSRARSLIVKCAVKTLLSMSLGNQFPKMGILIACYLPWFSAASKRIAKFYYFWHTGLKEHFQDSCGGVPLWLDSKTYYTAFTEGWGLYSENPLISDDTDTYKDSLLQKYGMLKWQVRTPGGGGLTISKW
jgi:hypothetical protein